MLEKTAAAVGIGAASLLLGATPALAFGSNPATSQAPAEGPYFENVCFMPFSMSGPLGEMLGFNGHQFSEDCVATSGTPAPTT